MKKHFLLLALAAICSLGVMGETIVVDWGHGKTNTLPANSSSGPIDGITLSSDIPFDGEYNGDIGYNDYYDFKGADVLSSRSVIIRASENVTLTKINAVGRAAWGVGDLIFEFYSSAENLTSSSLLKSETMKIAQSTTSNTNAEYAAPSGEETKAIKIYRPSSYWNGRPLLLSVTITAESAAAPVGPVDPITKFDNGTYYIGSTGLDLSSLLTTKNKDGAVTYTVKNANGTGAAISGSTFTATTAGTATVTASQEAVPDKYNAQSVDATITVTQPPLAKDVDFASLASSFPNISSTLTSNNYSMSTLSGVSWDSQGLDRPDTGLKMDGSDVEFSFWVAANKQVTIELGSIRGYNSGTVELDMNGTKKTLKGVPNDQTKSVINGPYPTSELTKCVIAFTNPYWSVIKKITISDIPYHVYFNANGGSGEITPLEVATGKPYNLPNCTFTAPANKSFAGWKMQGGTDEVYEVGAEFTMGSADVTFVAQWADKLKDPEITFDDATYKVGETTLDLSSLFHSKSSGAVTYSINSDDGAEAAITGTTFTAQHTGSVVVTASQARVEGDYDAGSKDATITVIAFASGETDFMYAAKIQSPQPNVADFLKEKNFVVSPYGDVQWDTNNYGHIDCGLKFESKTEDRDFSFWVKDNQKVTIQLGEWRGGNNTVELQVNGVKLTDLQAMKENGPYNTNGDTKFTIKVVDPYWSVIQKINIEALAYTLTLKAGDGTGDDVVEKLKENATYTLNKPDGFAKDGYHFKEWSDGTTTYAAGATFTMPAKNVTMTAIWEQNTDVKYTVTYANGGGNWTGIAPTEDDHKAGETFALPASSVVSRTGYQFAGWSDGTTTFAAEATYTMPAKAVTLTAMWNKLYSVTYKAGSVTYSGVMPTEPDHIDGATFKVADAIHVAGYAFKGWNDNYNTYQPGHEYTMPASNLVFTAQWEAVTVPTVTDLTITEPVNEIVPLSWNIPGLVDMSKATAPYQPTTDPTDKNPKLVINADGSVTSTFTLGNCGNSGVGFPIPSGVVDKMSFEYKVALPSGNCFVWGGAGNGDGEPHVNWQGKSTGMLTGDKADWTPAQCTMNEHYWEGNKHTDADDQVAIYVNADNSYTDKSITVRNVRYHATGMSDVEIAKVTLVRKAGEASTSPTDGVVLINQQVAFDFTDTQAKEPGTYYYTVFAYDAEGNYSAAVTTEYVLEVKQTYTVTYAKGGEDVMGEVPVDEMPKVEGTKFNLPAPGSLQKPYCQFNGWNDGNTTYAAGQEYTMPANNVTFTAQWGAEEQGLRIPENTVRLNYANQSTSTSHDMFDGEESIILGGLHSAEWNVYITPCEYTIEFNYGTIAYACNLTIELIDPATNQVVLTYNTGSHTPATGYTLYTKTFTWDLSGVIVGKKYIVRAIDKWNDTTSSLRLGHIDFIPTITIDQSKEDNLIFDGKANVTLIRPLVGGTTYSICLPFALNRDQINTAFGTDAEVWALTSSTLSANNMTLDIEFEQVEEMAAGVPYLIQPGTGYDATVNPVFNEIEMSTALNPVEQDNLDFIGVVQKSFVSVGFKDHLFVGANNEVFYPDGSGYLNGMRSYFKIKYHPEAQVTEGVQARMILGRTTPTELQTIKANDSVRKVMVNGRIHIIRNGVTNDILGNTIK